MSPLRAPRATHALYLCAVALGVALCARPGTASLITTGVYQLSNHPGGSAAPPGYGLRLDELFDVTSEHDRFTFDFDHPDASMSLTYDGMQVHITGMAFGGLDIGDAYHPDPALTSLVLLDFTYTVTTFPFNDDDLLVNTPSNTNSGTIIWLDTGEVINLYDRANMDGFTFRFGDGQDNGGYRGFNGISGWGWLDHHQPGIHIKASDWFFTATPMPGAPVLAMLGTGVLLGCRRRRR